MDRKELREPDDEHHRSVFDVDDEVIPNLRQDVAQSLGQNHIEHRLEMRHPNRGRTLSLSWVDADDAAAHGLGDVRPRVDRHHKNRHPPKRAELQRIIRKVRQPVKDKHGLQNHWSPAEYLDIDPNHHANQRQGKPLEQRVSFGVRDGL